MTTRILLLGDGNFSFTLALCRAIQNDSASLESIGIPTECLITATSFDTKEQVLEKYQESKDIFKAIETFKFCQKLHGINAWELSKHFDQKFDCIIWNHPHLGTEDFRLHRFLMAHFFDSVASVLKEDGQVRLSLVQGQETRWDVVEQAKKSGLNVASIQYFDETLWPGYVVKRNMHGKSFKNQATKRHTNSIMKSFSIQFKRGAYSVDIAEYMSSLTITSKPKKIEKSRHPVPADLTCRYCSKQLDSARAYNQHVHMVHILKQFGDWIPDRPKTIQCKECDKLFATENDLQQHHINKHTPSVFNDTKDAVNDCEYYPCQICGSAVASIDNGYSLHLEQLKPALGLNMKCFNCPKTFIETRALSQHYKFCFLNDKEG